MTSRDRVITSKSLRPGASPPLFDFLVVKISDGYHDDENACTDDDQTGAADSFNSPINIDSDTNTDKSQITGATHPDNEIHTTDKTHPSFLSSIPHKLGLAVSRWHLRWVTVSDNIVFIYKNELQRQEDLVYMFTLQRGTKVESIQHAYCTYGFKLTLPHQRGVVYFSTHDTRTVELWMMTFLIRAEGDFRPSENFSFCGSLSITGNSYIPADLKSRPPRKMNTLGFFYKESETLKLWKKRLFILSDLSLRYYRRVNADNYYRIKQQFVTDMTTAAGQEVDDEQESVDIKFDQSVLAIANRKTTVSRAVRTSIQTISDTLFLRDLRYCIELHINERTELAFLPDGYNGRSNIMVIISDEITTCTDIGESSQHHSNDLMDAASSYRSKDVLSDDADSISTPTAPRMHGIGSVFRMRMSSQTSPGATAFSASSSNSNGRYSLRLSAPDKETMTAWAEAIIAKIERCKDLLDIS